MEHNIVKAYTIHCGTGCSCCSDDNHYCGPYSTREVANRWKQDFHNRKKLASQYAENGRYTIEEHDAEILPDGRVIIDSRIFGAWADESGWVEIESAPFGRGYA